MGAKTCMLAFSDGDLANRLGALPPIDRARSAAFAAALFPGAKLEQLADGTLCTTYPANREVLSACFGGSGVAVATEFAVDRPSQLPAAFLRATGGAQTVYLHAMHSVVDWFAFGVWKNGLLVRALSVSPDSGVIEDIGERLPFELPFWQGDHRYDDQEARDTDEKPYTLPFHPLDMGEAALRAFFGFTIEGEVAPGQLDPEAVALMRFRRKRSLFSFWK